MKTTFLSVAMLVASVSVAMGFDTDPTIAIHQPCVTVQEGTAEVMKSRDAACGKEALVKAYFNVCKGQMLPGQKTPLPADEIIADQVCPPPVDAALSYWFLGQRISGDTTMITDSGHTDSVATPVNYAPQALGPYPSLEMCVAAERGVAPSHRGFWTTAEKKLWEKYDWQLAERQAQESAYADTMAWWFKRNPKPGRYVILPGGGKYKGAHFETLGKVTDVVYSPEVGQTIERSATEGAEATSPDIWQKIVTTEWPTPPEKLPADSYTILDECAPVHGWAKP